MKCPCCLAELELGKRMKLETLTEHVCNPNGEIALKDSYHCSNTECQAYKDEVVWNEDGERYGFKNNSSWLNGNDAPIPSFQRRMNVEIYKHDENYTLFTLFGWECKIEFKYISNEEGDILKRWRKVVWIRPNRTVYISGFHMLRYGISQTYRAWKKLGKNPSLNWCVEDLNGYVEKRFRDEEWWRKVCRVFALIALKHRGIVGEKQHV